MSKPDIFLLFVALIGFTSSLAASIVSSSTQPGQVESFVPKSKLQSSKSCSYTVVMKTSCSSISYTRDKISIAFGDKYHNEVYVKKLDDPYSRAFERCSTDTYQLNGPCMNDVCYLYLLRQGSDGWKPQTVKIYGSYIRPLKYDYNVFLPNGVWYGFNVCSTRSSVSTA